MKFNALVAALAAVCLAGPALADSYIDGWIGQAHQAVDARLAKAGLVSGGQPLDVRLHVDGDGALSSPVIVASSGSTDLDAAVLKALRHVRATQPPPELSGRALLFHLSVAPNQTASLQTPTRR